MARKRGSSVLVKIPLDCLKEAIPRLSVDDILLLKDTIEKVLSTKGVSRRKNLSKMEIENLLAKTHGIWARDSKIEAAFRYLGYRV